MKRHVVSLAQDLVFVAGLAAVGTGLWWERPSAALIVLGAIASAATWYGAARRPSKQRTRRRGDAETR